MELNQFELGLSWLLAAANEDVRYKRVKDATESYALESNGVFGQWVQSRMMNMLPVEVIPFVEGIVGAIGFDDVMNMLRSLLHNGAICTYSAE